MATYVIGDVQGGYTPLRQLLEIIAYDARRDTLWFVGDLVNRGQESLAVLRFVMGLGAGAVTVLGNHDLHLLAVAAHAERQKPGDTLQEILQAPDRDQLIDWLRNQPLLHYDPGFDCYMIHAGLPPQWTPAQAVALATEVETQLRAADYRDYFHHMYGNQPEQWHDDLAGWDRLRFITNCFTRLRYCDAGGRLALKEKGRPGSQPATLLPWFKVPGRRSAEASILFGHWSTLGAVSEHNVISLDCGCVWGGQLVAYCLDTTRFYQVECEGALRPGQGD